MKTIYLSLLLVLLTICQSKATHNRAGEILLTQIDDLTVQASIVTYTKLSSIPADRDTLIINWGDGTTELVARSNGPNNNGEPLSNDSKKNVYTQVHTYTSMGTYTVSMTDPFRNHDVLNVNPPFSADINFHIETIFTLIEMEPGTVNTMPVLLQPPIDVAFLGESFVHVPNAFDLDGDSIAFEFAIPLQDVNDPVPNYTFPDQINSGSNNTLTLDSVTGVLTWNSPQLAGEYNIAILIKSYRNGVETDRMLRDMQILVMDEMEFAPDVDFLGAIENVVTPVALGDTIRIDFEVSTSSASQSLNATSSCALYSENGFYNNIATIDYSIAGNNGTATFEWIVKEEHLRQFPYQLVFKASAVGVSDGAATFAIFRFRTIDFVTENREINERRRLAKVYPNPVRDMLFLETDLTFPLTYNIVNMAGRILQTDVLVNAEQAIKTQTLPGGYHILQLTSKNGRTEQVKICISK